MPRLLKFSKITWAVVALFSALVVVLWFAGERCDVRVVHLGYTNAPITGGKYAVFAITNAGAGNITIWPEFFVESDGPPIERWSGELRQLFGLIPTGSARQYVPVPETASSWRFTILCSPDSFRTELGAHLGAGEKGLARKLLRDWIHVVPLKRVTSEWISGLDSPTSESRQ